MDELHRNHTLTVWILLTLLFALLVVAAHATGRRQELGSEHLQDVHKMDEALQTLKTSRKVMTTSLDLDSLHQATASKFPSQSTSAVIAKWRDACSLPRDVQRKIRNGETYWKVTDEVLSLVDNDIQSIIECTQPWDLLRFEVTQVVKPKRSMVIQWPLKIYGNPVPESVDSTTFTCPNDGPLLSIEDPQFAMYYIIVSSCDMESSIVKAESILEDEATWNKNTSVLLHEVKFWENHVKGVGNSLIDTKLLLSWPILIQYSQFVNNICEDDACVSLGKNSTFHETNITQNQGKKNGCSSAMFQTMRDSTLQVKSCNLWENQLQLFALGAGVNALFNRTEFSQNWVHDDCRICGGAVSAHNHCSVVYNYVGFTDHEASNGGALCHHHCTIIIRGSHFRRNSATSGNGGALYIASNSKLKIFGSNFTENSAAGRGGGLYTEDAINSFINGTQFLANIAHDGGALAAQEQCNFNVRWSYFKKNVAQEYGGAVDIAHQTIFNVKGSHFKDNMAKRAGGALNVNHGSQFWGVDFRFERNKATDGGAIFLHHESRGMGKLGYFVSNVARSYGGAVGVWLNSNFTAKQMHFNYNGNQKGGALAAHADSLLSVYYSYFRGNNATYGGAVFVKDHSKAEIDHTSFDYNNGSYGGVVHILGQSAGNIFHSHFTDNRAEECGGVFFVNDSSTVSILETDAHRNEAWNGGVIALYEKSHATVKLSEFAGNGAVETGGVIKLWNMAAMEMEECRLVENTASEGGAVDVNWNCRAKIERSSFTKNKARQYGGAVKIDSLSSSDITESSFEQNIAEKSGGGIFVNKNGQATLKWNTFFDNEARSGGGVYIIQAHKVHVTSGQFRGNQAKTHGGAVFTEGERILVLNDVSFLNNKAVVDGNDVFTQEAEMNGYGCSGAK